MLIKDLILDYKNAYIATTSYSNLGDLSALDTTQTANLKVVIANLNLATKKLSERFKIYKRELFIPYGTPEIKLPSDFLSIEAIRFEDGTVIPVGTDNYSIGNTDRSKKLSDPFSTRNKVNITNFGVSINEPYILSVYGDYPEDKKGLSIVLKYSRIVDNIITSKITDTFAFPPQYLTALYNYAAYLQYQSISPNVKADNNSFYIRYESECRRLEQAQFNTAPSYQFAKSVIDSDLP